MYAALDASAALSGRTVLSGIRLALPPGELTIVVGPNGAGKSTLLNLLTGVLRASGGEVQLDGRPLSAWPRRALALRRAVLAQSQHLAFPFTLFEVVALGRTAGAAQHSAATRRLVLDCLAAVDLAGYAGRLFQQLSGGEQQRAHIARVLCQLGGPDAATGEDGRPTWLFLDEPTTSLDIAHQLAVLDIARRRARAGGGAFAILHDLNLASLYADRLIMLANGRSVGDGSPQAVLTEPLVRSVFGERVKVVPDPATGRSVVLPMAAEDRSDAKAGLSGGARSPPAP